MFSEEWSTRRRVRRAKPRRRASALVWQPEPRVNGSPRRGAQIVAGLWHLAGQIVEIDNKVPDLSPWDMTPPSAPFAMQLHGQGWLDDLMAVGDRAATDKARTWVLDWARRYGTGRGPGWAPALTGRRLLRWISHAPVLLQGMQARDQRLWFDVVYAQAGFLDRYGAEAPEGLPRMEALAGLLYAALTLEGLDGLAERAAQALTATADRDVDAFGGIASRNPEALLEVAMLIGWALDALRAKGPSPSGLIAAQERVIPTLRALRQADGSLPRFHGGGRGREGRLDRVLAESGIPTRNGSLNVMGFVPLSTGRTTLIADGGKPPLGEASGSAGASTGAFELTSGPCPVIVNCGPGGAFGPEWHRAGRATASHSTLSVDGHSTARIGPLIPLDGRKIAPLILGPEKVQWQVRSAEDAVSIMVAHTGYVPQFGLTHIRRLSLSKDGRELKGEDSLRCIKPAEQDAFQAALAKGNPNGIPFRLRFHLHPDSEAALDLGGRAVSIVLPSGEVWIFRPGRRMKMELEPSVHLEPERLRPRPSQQVVLRDRVVKYAATINWSLIRAQEATELPPSPAERL